MNIVKAEIFKKSILVTILCFFCTCFGSTMEGEITPDLKRLKARQNIFHKAAVDTLDAPFLRSGWGAVNDIVTQHFKHPDLEKRNHRHMVRLERQHIVYIRKKGKYV